VEKTKAIRKKRNINDRSLMVKISQEQWEKLEAIVQERETYTTEVVREWIDSLPEPGKDCPERRQYEAIALQIKKILLAQGNLK
jgi:hypothetical protein